MRVVTSFGPRRIERQQKCLKSWIAAGCEVTGIQSPGEVEMLSPLFPEVNFKETNLVGNLFARPKLVRINALINEAPVLILNSDIEVRATPEVFAERWSSVGEKQIKIGIRWNEDPVTKATSLFKWGVDAFLIEPWMIHDLPDIGMTMGCPAWDYWIPIKLHKSGYKIITQKQEELIHEDHEKQWTLREYQAGLGILQKHTGMGRNAAANLVQRLTDRSSLRR